MVMRSRNAAAAAIASGGVVARSTSCGLVEFDMLSMDRGGSAAGFGAVFPCRGPLYTTRVGNGHGARRRVGTQRQPVSCSARHETSRRLRPGQIVHSTG